MPKARVRPPELVQTAPAERTVGRTARRALVVLLAGALVVGLTVPTVRAGQSRHASPVPTQPERGVGVERSPDDNATVTGTVRTTDGEPVADAVVFAVATSAHAHRLVEGDDALLPHHDRPPIDRYRDLVDTPRPPGVYVTRADENGTYTLPVPPANYTVHALAPRSSPDPDRAGPGLAPARTRSLSAGERTSVTVELTGQLLADCFCPFIDVATATGSPNETVTVSVSTNAGARVGPPGERRNVTGYDLTLTFDPRVVGIVDVEGADLGEPETVEVDNEFGRVRVAEAGTDPVAGPKLARIEFRVLADSPTETYLLFDPNTTVLSGDERITPQSSLDGKITVVPSVVALVAGEDGRVQFAELQRAARRYASGEPVPGSGGETVDLADLQELATAWAADEPVDGRTTHPELGRPG